MTRFIIDRAPKGGWCLFDAETPEQDEEGAITPSAAFTDRHDLLLHLDREMAKAEGDTSGQSIAVVANDEDPPTGGTFRSFAKRWAPRSGKVKAA